MKSVALALLAFLSVVSSAFAQQQCGPVNDITRILQDRYGEKPVAVGRNVSGAMVLYGSVETGTWTILIIKPDGVACVVAGGQQFRVAGEAA